MADSFVEVTEGSGKTVDTRTEGTNGNHRQVIIIGDPATNAGVAPVDATNGLAVDVKQSALPSGAATSAKQDTGNTSIASIDSKFPALGQALAAASIPVILPSATITTLTPPAAITGYATSAKQDTIIGHIDNIEGLLTTIDADTGNISTKIDTVAGAVSGTEMQVDVVGSLPAGSNAIGKLAANSGVDIGDVDVTSVIPGTGATNLGKAIDSATGATDTGVLALATRDDALSTLTPAEGDNVQLRTTSTGALWVTQSGTVTVDGSGVTQPVSNAGLTELAAAINSSKLDVNIVSSDVASGGTSAADDADFTATTTTGTPAMGVYESTPTNVTDGDMGIVGITTGRRLKTSSTIDTALPAGTNNIGDVDVLSSALPTGASTLAEQQSQTTHLATIAGDTTDIEAAVELIDDTVTTLGTTTYTEGSSKGLTIGAVRRDADTTLVDTTNEFGPLQMDANGRLKVEAFSGEALPVTLTSTTVTGTVAVTQSGTWDEVGINDSGNSITVDNGGTFAVQVDGSALTSLQLIDDVVYTDDTSTHSTGTSKGVGMMAVAVPTDTSVNANDIAMIAMSTDRRQLSDVTLQVADTDVSITNPVPTKGVPSDIDINGNNANHAQKYYTNAGAVTDGIIWSPAAGKRWHVLTLYINVSAAATVTLEDDLAGGDSAVWKGELAANSGVVLTYDKEHPFSSTEDAADLIVTTTAGNVYIQAVGYEV